MLTHRPFDFPIGLLIDATYNAIYDDNVIYDAGYSRSAKYPVIVAGGYLRDHVLDREINDIDLYIDVRSIKNFKGNYDQFVDKIIAYKQHDKNCFSHSISPSIKMENDGTLSVTIVWRNVPTTISLPVSPSYVITSATPTTVNYSATNSPKTQVNTGHISKSGIVSVVNRHISSNTDILSTVGFNVMWNVQFIFICRDPIEYVSQDFIMDLARIYYNGNKTVMLPEFVNAVMTKVNHFYKRSWHSADQVEAYKAKIEDKFSDFKHVVLEESEAPILC